jgi:hypothetical protein
MIKAQEIKVGSLVKCVNGDGWANFKRGEVYPVTELWLGNAAIGIDINGRPVSTRFYGDFELVKEA